MSLSQKQLLVSEARITILPYLYHAYSLCLNGAARCSRPGERRRNTFTSVWVRLLRRYVRQADVDQRWYRQDRSHPGLQRHPDYFVQRFGHVCTREVFRERRFGIRSHFAGSPSEDGGWWDLRVQSNYSKWYFHQADPASSFEWVSNACCNLF